MNQQKLSGRLMLDLDGKSLSSEEIDLLRQQDVGGVILFSRNIESRDQVVELCREVRAVAPNLLLAVDQEGGRVQRLREGYTRLPSMQQLGDYALQNRDAGLALLRDCGWLMASEVIASGLDISFAPVLDIDRDLSTIIGDRAFTDSAASLVDFAGAFIEGMNEAGMAATGKHFPGHGGVVADSHLELPCDPRDMEALEARDLIPFRALMPKLGGIMPGHILFPAVDDSQPVGFSAYWLQQILRGTLGFNGVIFSDDLSMKGADVAGSYADKTKLALQAGCDMVLVCNHREGALQSLEYLRNSQTGGSARIAAMRTGESLDWTALEKHPRRQQTRAQLQTLAEID